MAVNCSQSLSFTSLIIALQLILRAVPNLQIFFFMHVCMCKYIYVYIYLGIDICATRIKYKYMLNTSDRDLLNPNHF